jgi:biopolymer transport protein ExbD
MGVIIPGYHLRAHSDMPQTRRRLKGYNRRKEIITDITLTSLIDIFSVVILFLIQSFSASGEILIINPALSLPQAYHASPLMRAPIVTILPDKVTVEGLNVGDNSDLSEKVEETDWALPLLQQKLESYRDFVRSLSPDIPFSGEVIVQADAQLDFIYLKRVLFTLTRIGFTNINLAVRGDAANTIGEALKPAQEIIRGTGQSLRQRVQELGTKALEATD